MPAPWHHVEVYREFPGGAGLNGVTVNANLLADDSLIATTTSATVGVEDGVAQLNLDDTATTGQSSYVLHPGPYYVTGTAAGINVTRTQSSTVTGSTGPLNIAAMHLLARAIGNGLISSPGQGLNTGEVTADGADLTVDVATFAACIQGLTSWNDAIRALDITANVSGNPRIDTVVVEVIPAGNATEGRWVLKMVDGTPAGSPVAPTLTQTTTAWQLPLADVAVADSASVISQGNITDRRDFVERATTTVEADVVALEAEVDEIQGGAGIVPHERIVATYSAAFDPPSMAAATWNKVKELTEGDLTFHNGYSALDDTMFAQASHIRAGTSDMLTYANVINTVGVRSVMVIMVNTSAGTLNPTSATLTVVVTKLVTS